MEHAAAFSLVKGFTVVAGDDNYVSSSDLAVRGATFSDSIVFAEPWKIGGLPWKSWTRAC